MEEDEKRRAWHFENYSMKVNNLSLQEQMNVSPYQLPSASDYGTPTMPDSLRMHMAVQSYPRAAKNRSAELRQLRENRSPAVETMNFELNGRASEIQFNSLAATPQVLTLPENRWLNVRKSARTAKALYEKAGTGICQLLRCMSRSPVESARMCGDMMTVDMYDMICVVAEYVGIEVHMYAEVVDVFTMTLMYRDVMDERIETTVCKAFSRGSV